ncbi:hypothetical protein ACFL67_00180 [candidate division KSB1 bacterium]
MKLGEHLQIALSVEDIQKTKEFFDRLGHRKTDNFDPQPFAVEMLADGYNLIGLNERAFHSPVLKYYARDFDEVVKYLESLDCIVNTVKDGEKVMAASVFDPSEQHIVVLPLETRNIPEPENKSVVGIGTFEEYAIPVEDLNVSLAFWKSIGYEPIQGAGYGGKEPYPWQVITDGLLMIGLHQTQEFPVAGLAYYHPEQKQNIEILRSGGMEFAAEMKDKNGDVVSAIAVTPDQQPVFIFQGEIKRDKV